MTASEQIRIQRQRAPTKTTCVTSGGTPLSWERLVLRAFLSPINLNVLVIQFLLIRLFSLLVEFSAAF